MPSHYLSAPAACRSSRFHPRIIKFRYQALLPFGSPQQYCRKKLPTKCDMWTQRENHIAPFGCALAPRLRGQAGLLVRTYSLSRCHSVIYYTGKRFKYTEILGGRMVTFDMFALYGAPLPLGVAAAALCVLAPPPAPCSRRGHFISAPQMQRRLTARCSPASCAAFTPFSSRFSFLVSRSRVGMACRHARMPPRCCPL